jgi:hypothetical protein
MNATAMTLTGMVPIPGGAGPVVDLRSAYSRTAKFVQTVALVERRQQWFRFERVPGEGTFPELQAALSTRFPGPVPTIEISPGRIDDAISFMEEVHPQPENDAGQSPLWLRLIWVIRIIDPLTGEPLPGQGAENFDESEYNYRVPLGTSAIDLWLGNRPKLSMSLCLPNVDDESFTRIHSSLQTHAPVRLPDENWRRWTLTDSIEHPGRAEWDSAEFRFED